MVEPGTKRLLLVEDNDRLRQTLTDVLSRAGWEVHIAPTTAAALAALGQGRRPDVLLVDVALPDGSAVEIVEEARRRHPSPRTIAMSGQATPSQAFRLAELGVRCYLQKPLDMPTLFEALENVDCAAPDLAPHVLESVGHRAIRDVEAEVRREMVDEALARTGGNRQRAADLLSISRQLLQHILRGRE